MNSKPFLSICIPAYNKSDRLKKNITSILNACDDEIEIVVVDNVSSENLEEVCKSFNDPRISYYRNETPIAATANWFRSIRLAKGQWAFLMMDRDFINGKGIPSVIEALKKNSTCGAARVGYLGDGGDEIYAQNPRIESCKIYPAREIETLFTLKKRGHPTGKIYNKEYLALSEAYENVMDQNPRFSMQLYIMFKPVWDNGFLSIRMTDRMCYLPPDKYLKTYKSGWIASQKISAKAFDSIHYPDGFMRWELETLKEMLKLDLSLVEKKELCVQAYNGFMKQEFIGMISRPRSSSTWYHHNEKYKYRTGKERKRISVEFCEYYKQNVKLILGDDAEDVLAEITPIRIDRWTYMKPTVRAMKSAIIESPVIRSFLRR